MDDLVMPQEGEHGRYRVGFLEKARREGRTLLSLAQYAYAVRIVRRLGEWGDPDALKDLRIEGVDSFYELKLKGNVLGKTNLRVFFSVFDDADLIVVLGPYIKEQEGHLPKQIVLKMRNRHRIASNLVSLEVQAIKIMTEVKVRTRKGFEG